ncbi:MAG TPA: hypothetical protein VMZ74_04450 [Ramlibacter sp.]|nr:hypothetical protein [Ramlibacter sp.]
MRTLIYGLVVALGLGAIAAPVLAGLLGAAGLASAPSVRLWLFMVPETICGIAGVDNPGLVGLIAGWTVEFIPLGIVAAAVGQVLWRRNVEHREAAFEHAVTEFHDDEAEAGMEAEYE